MKQVILELTDVQKTEWEEAAGEQGLTILEWIKELGNKYSGDAQFYRYVEEIAEYDYKLAQALVIAHDKTWLNIFLSPCTGEK